MSDKKKLTDAEILKLIEDFEKLPQQKKIEKHLGAGAFKDTYDIHPDYVLKEPMSGDKSTTRQMLSDYMESKEMGRHIPVEQPMLVLRENKNPIHIQRKLSTPKAPDLEFSRLDKTTRELKAQLKEKGIDPLFSDIGTNNAGFDELGNTKVFDPMATLYDSSNPRSTPAFRAKTKALARLANMGGTKIYRSLIPLLTGGAGLAFSAASEASDAEELGNTSEQGALLREVDSQNQMKKIESSTSVPDNIKLKALELFKKNKLPY